MHAQAEVAQRRAGSFSPDGDSLLAELLGIAVDEVARPPWAAPARLAPLHPRCRPAPVWPAARLVARRPLALAAAALIAGGLVTMSLGPAPARAAAAPVSAAAPAALAPARSTLHGLRVAAASSAADEALLSRLLAAPVGRATPATLPAFEFADETAAAPAAPADVSFTTVAGLPSAAFDYAPAAVQLPAITLEQQRSPYPPDAPPPPAPPVPVTAQSQQPPPPPGYVQPPGYQDGVPFGGQPGAVPAARPSRPAGGASPSPRPVVASTHTVRAGDTLASIALHYYGNARYADVIWGANYNLIGSNPNLIFPGQRLVIPGISTRPAATAPLPARGPIAQRAFYTIQPRDFLRWIAQRAYGNERFWPEIYHANRNVLGPNPDLIYPGVRVYIP